MTIRTSLDFTQVNGLIARRKLRERSPALKLGILQRLAKQFVAGTLPQYTETNLEQSWNEQVFAKVLGYQSQFSHDRLPFHLKAKDFGGGYYADFSLGFFGSGPDRVLVSAELKGPRASLDKAQSGKSYNGLTPVQQAIRAANMQPGCRWALVSNFAELRLYSLAAPETPIVTAFLNEITGTRDLALLQGVLGQEAVLGVAHNPPELDRMIHMDNEHPGAPISARDGDYRLVVRFTPKREQEKPLFRAEQELVAAIDRAPASFRMFERPDFGRARRLRTRLKDGWIAVDGFHRDNSIASRVAMSLLGQVQASFRFKADTVTYDGRTVESVHFGWILNGLRFFGGVLESMQEKARIRGLIAAELRDVNGSFLHLGNSLAAPSGADSGVSEFNDILAGDFSHNGARDTLEQSAATCACELAAYFRTADGGVAASLEAVRKNIETLNAQDLDYAAKTWGAPSPASG